MKGKLECENLSWKQTLAYALGAVAAFHLAYSFAPCSFLIAVYLFCLFRLANLSSPRKAFYIGFAIGYATFAPQLFFIWTIFNAAALALWAVLAFWIGLFLVLSQLVRKRFGARNFALLVPFLWMGLEYFRSELYYLRFSWMNVGYVFSNTPELLRFTHVGVYGIGFLLMAIIAALSLFRRKLSCGLTTTFIFLLGVTLHWLVSNRVHVLDDTTVSVAGIQIEFPSEANVPFALNKLTKKFPEAELLVLSEYTFDGPIPEKVKAWCRDHEKYLIAGGKDPLPDGQYYNTAFVVDPKGEIVFRQAKSVPIQFFKDGLPAAKQEVWNSPWGKIGLCICYDLSYRKVVDGLIEKGAQAIIVPTMDVSDWGKRQHEIHARVAPTRAAEYGIPIFRVCSSGISQLVTAWGKVEQTAPFPGDEAMISGSLLLQGESHLPFYHWLAPFSVFVTGSVAFVLLITSFRFRKIKTS